MLLDTLYNTAAAQVRAIFQRIAASDEPLAYIELYKILDAYYHNNALYAELHDILRNAEADTTITGLRNPANAVVEFYVATVMPGSLKNALPIEATNDQILPAIQQVWQWSNLQRRKQPLVRWAATYGDAFLKASTRLDRNDNPARAFIQLFKPEYVTAFDEDERGFITYIRLDIPQIEREGDDEHNAIYTEVWDKASGRYQTWQHRRGRGVNIEVLGRPDVDESIESFGIDFVPFVRATFRDSGDDRGAGAFTHALDVIDEANRQASRLHQTLFRHDGVNWVLRANGTGNDKRPLPPVRLPGIGTSTTSEADTVKVGRDRMYSLPGNSSLEALVPNINYEAARNILRDQQQAIEEYALPEMAYYRLPELGGNTSGRALRLILSSPIARVEETRGNLETAIAQVTAMCLTLGAHHNLPGFTDIGTFEQGDFAHIYAERDVIPLNDLESAQADEARTRTLELKRNELGIPRRQIWHEAGYTEEQITQMLADAEHEASAVGDALLRRWDGQ